MTTLFALSTYPVGLDSFTPRLQNLIDDVIDNHQNEPYKAIEAIQAKLGIDNGVATGFGAFTFSGLGKASYPGSLGSPGIWCDNTGGPGFPLKYTDDLGATYTVELSSTGTDSLNDVYRALPSATVTVDVWDVIWNLTGAYSHVVDLSAVTGTADGFIVQNGTDQVQFLSAAANQILADIDVETLDIDAGAGGFSIDSLGASSNLTNTSTGAGQDLTISLAGAFDSSLVLSSTGTGVDAVKVSASAGGLTLDSFSSMSISSSSGDIRLSDSYNAGSTWTQVYITLSDATSEWDDFETNFGEVSLFNALNQASQTLQDVYDKGNTIITPDARPFSVGSGSGYAFEVFYTLASNTFNVDFTGDNFDIDSAYVYIRGANYLSLDDSNRSGSTWVQGYVTLSDAIAEWDTYKTNFGEVSLFNAISQAYSIVHPLDDVYSVSASTVTVDAYDVIWNLTGAYSHVIDLTAATGAADGFIVQNGTDQVSLLRAAVNQITADLDVQTWDLSSAGVLGITSVGSNINFSALGGAAVPFNDATDLVPYTAFTSTSVIGTINENSIIRHSYELNAATYTIAAEIMVVEVIYTTTSTCVVTIPSAEIAKVGRVFVIVDKGRNSASNVITIETQGSELIMGETDAQIQNNGESLTLISDGTDLIVI